MGAGVGADLETLQLRAAVILTQLSRSRVCVGCEQHRVQCIFEPGHDECRRCRLTDEFCIIDDQKLRWGPNEHKLLREIAKNGELLDPLLNQIANPDLPSPAPSTMLTVASEEQAQASIRSASSDDSLFYFDWSHTPASTNSRSPRSMGSWRRSRSQSAGDEAESVGALSASCSSVRSPSLELSEASSAVSYSSRMASESQGSAPRSHRPARSGSVDFSAMRSSSSTSNRWYTGSEGGPVKRSTADSKRGRTTRFFRPTSPAYSVASSAVSRSRAPVVMELSPPPSPECDSVGEVPSDGEEITTSWVPLSPETEYLSSPESIQFISPLPGSSADDLVPPGTHTMPPQNVQQFGTSLSNERSYSRIDRDDYGSMSNYSVEWDTESIRSLDRSRSPSFEILHASPGRKEENAEEQVGDWSGNQVQPMQVSQFGAKSVINSSMTYAEISAVLTSHGCVDLTKDLDANSFSDFPVSSGGFGDVYSGRLNNGTRIAIKAVRFHPDQSEGGKYLKRAAKELHTWSKCRHVNVLELLGFTDFWKRVGMVSLWVENGSVRVYLGRHPEIDRYRLCYGIADGLAYLHGIKIVHGDLKGLNVLISDDGTPKLTDFGNSVLHECSVQYTNSKNDLSISPRWTAPEILEGQTTYSYAADVFALGMTLLETITGNIPYHDLAQDLAVIMAVAIKRKFPERPDAHIPLNVEYGDVLWSLLTKCWAYESKNRPNAAFVRDMMAEVVHKRILHRNSC